MSRKRKKTRQTRAGAQRSQVQVSPAELESRGLQALEAERYRDAISAFKDLVRRESRPEWVEALGQAYTGRARGLVEKGMFKEATAILRNRAEFCNKTLADLTYLELLFRTGQVEVAVQLIREHRKAFEQQDQLEALQALCAAQVLAGNGEILDAFPADDPLVRDYPVATAAMQAYTEGRDGELEARLKAIPFRSPFRDLRQILKALSLLEVDPAGAEGLVDRIDAASPFSPLCWALRASRLPDQEFVHEYRGMDKAVRRFALVLRGWSPQQITLAQELAQLGQYPASDALLRFVIRHRKALGEDWLREIGMRLLMFSERGVERYGKMIGPLSIAERKRMDALHLEHEGAQPYKVFNAWHNACEELYPKKGLPEGQLALDAALMLRHAVRVWPRSQPLHEACLGALDQSLILDPDDRDTYLELIGLYRERDRLKDARRLLDLALARWPRDAGVLTEAVETATAGGAYKKAARFARQALELDPINPKVRDILVGSHLAHVRKQIRQGKRALAYKELKEADHWARADLSKGRIALTRGILELRDGDGDAARESLLAGIALTGGGLTGWLHLFLEAGRMDYEFESFVAKARLPEVPSKADRRELLALIKALDGLSDDEKGLAGAAVNLLEPAVAASAQLEYSRSEAELICEAWLDLGLDELRSSYARAALRRWPGVPMFVFHRIDAGYTPYRSLDTGDLDELFAAEERAQDEGDMRSAHRIAELLDKARRRGMPGEAVFGPFGGEGSPPGLPEGMDPEEFLDMIMSIKGPAEFEALKRELAPEELRLFLKMMLEGGAVPDQLEDILPEPVRPRPRRRRTS